MCYLLGFRFAPRIRDLPDRRLFTFRAPKEYGVLKDLIADRVDVGLLQRNWNELLRLADSIREGRSVLPCFSANWPVIHSTARRRWHCENLRAWNARCLHSIGCETRDCADAATQA
jgi:Tn3 transposase DDE domain